MNKALKRHGKRPFQSTPYWSVWLSSKISKMTDELKSRTEQILRDLEGLR